MRLAPAPLLIPTWKRQNLHHIFNLLRRRLTLASSSHAGRSVSEMMRGWCCQTTRTNPSSSLKASASLALFILPVYVATHRRFQVPLGGPESEQSRRGISQPRRSCDDGCEPQDLCSPRPLVDGPRRCSFFRETLCGGPLGPTADSRNGFGSLGLNYWPLSLSDKKQVA